MGDNNSQNSRTLSKAWINMEKTERTPGTTSRVKTLSSCVIEPMTHKHSANIKSSKTLKHQLNEEDRLNQMAQKNLQQISQGNVLPLFRLGGMYWCDTPKINHLCDQSRG